MAPSSKERPLANEISKSFTSKDKVFCLGLFANNSCACSKIISFLFPFVAKRPSSSNFLRNFFLTQESIKQLPGPISLLKRFFFPFVLPIIVKFEIPPIFKIQTVNLILIFLQLIDEILGLKVLPHLLF